MLKLLFLIGCLCLTGVWSMSEEMQELINTLHKQCQEETSVPEDLIVNARTGNFAEEKSLKCYMKCIMAQMAVIDEDNGQIDIEAVVAVLPEETKDKSEKIIRKCGAPAGNDPCETAFIANKCWQKEDPALYFLP